ncbi:MAG: molybdate ABC transporter substrate-binding protein, partial [Planctomycetota bacterium]
PFGMLYASDLVAAAGSVWRVADVPEELHPPIRYPLAALSARAEVREVFEALQGPAARAQFAAAGFGVVSP